RNPLGGLAPRIVPRTCESEKRGRQARRRIGGSGIFARQANRIEVIVEQTDRKWTRIERFVCAEPASQVRFGRGGEAGTTSQIATQNSRTDKLQIGVPLADVGMQETDVALRIATDYGPGPLDKDVFPFSGTLIPDGNTHRKPGAAGVNEALALLALHH